MSLLEAILLGIVQGLTEFLPISSTAHLLVTRALLNHPYPEDAFTTVIQLGTLVAVFAYFRTDVIRLVRGFVADLGNLAPWRLGATADAREAWLIILGTVPVVIVGLTLKKWLKTTFYTPWAIGWVAIVFALLLALAEWWNRRRGETDVNGTTGTTGVSTERVITIWDALWIGLWQALALMPGGSRSGTTITGGLFAGLTRSTAARFSFLLSLPAILAAGVKELYDEYKKLRAPELEGPPSLFASGDDLTALLVGTAVSAIVGYLAIAWLLAFLRQRSTAVFIIYRLISGVVILGLVGLGRLK